MASRGRSRKVVVAKAGMCRRIAVVKEKRSMVRGAKKLRGAAKKAGREG